MMINSDMIGIDKDKKDNEYLQLFLNKEVLDPTGRVTRYSDELTENIAYNDIVLSKLGQSFQQFQDVTTQSIIEYKLESLIQEIKDIRSIITQPTKKQLPTVMTTKIYNLPSEEYELMVPIDVTLEIYEDEVLAIIPDLELYGEGRNQIEAVNDLKWELIDLYKDLEEMPDEELGDSPKAWKKTLQQLVNVCQ